MSDNKHKWDRQEDETPKAFNAFSIYRTLGPLRSLERVRVTLGKRKGYYNLLERWSSKYKWVERARAFDDYVDKQTEAESVERIARFNREAAEEAATLRKRMIEGMLKEDDDYLDPPEKRKRWAVAIDKFRSIHDLDKPSDKTRLEGEIVVKVVYPLGGGEEGKGGEEKEGA